MMNLSWKTSEVKNQFKKIEKKWLDEVHEDWSVREEVDRWGGGGVSVKMILIH